MPSAAGRVSLSRENNFASHTGRQHRPANSKIRSTRKNNITKCRYLYEWLSNSKSDRIASAMRARAGLSHCVADSGPLLPAVASAITLVALFFAECRLRGRAIAVSTMISEVYDALISAGAPEDKARKAAETLANYDNRFSRLDGAVLKVEYELALVKWMVGFGIAMNVAILTRLFFH
jgi:hypothetical protein